MSHTPASPSSAIPPGRRAAAEGIGTAFLLMAIVGSGIMADRMMNGDAGLALLANSIATGAALVALIVALGPLSGAHVNPVVTLSFAIRGGIGWGDAGRYGAAQMGGALAGVALANAMFGEPLLLAAATHRAGPQLWLGELVASFGLVAVILSAERYGPLVVAPVVGCYITSAYWFTSSTSFANPAVTMARALTDTFSGIHPGSVAPFVLAQCLGALAATGFVAWMRAAPAAFPDAERSRKEPA